MLQQCGTDGILTATVQPAGREGGTCEQYSVVPRCVRRPARSVSACARSCTTVSHDQRVCLRVPPCCYDIDRHHAAACRLCWLAPRDTVPSVHVRGIGDVEVARMLQELPVGTSYRYVRTEDSRRSARPAATERPPQTRYKLPCTVFGSGGGKHARRPPQRAPLTT